MNWVQIQYKLQNQVVTQGGWFIKREDSFIILRDNNGNFINIPVSHITKVVGLMQ